MKLNLTKTVSLTATEVNAIVIEYLQANNLIGKHESAVATSKLKTVSSDDYYDRGNTSYEFNGIDVKITPNK